MLTPALVEQLTVEAMVLVDEAESYFGGEDEPVRAALDPELQVAFACEAFRTDARLRSAIDWLIQRARAFNGEAEPPSLDLEPLSVDSPELARLPARARAIVGATRELCERVRGLRLNEEAPAGVTSPARELQARLASQLAAR